MSASHSTTRRASLEETSHSSSASGSICGESIHTEEDRSTRSTTPPQTYAEDYYGAYYGGSYAAYNGAEYSGYSYGYTNGSNVTDESSKYAHWDLLYKCGFVYFPTGSQEIATDAPTDGLSYPLFVGQVRFETTVGDLRWLIGQLTGAFPLRIDTRGPGCFIVHMSSEEDRRTMLMLHKRVLFDHSGAWYARSTEEVDAMVSHLSTFRTRRRNSRLPRGAMVVEDSREEPSTGVAPVGAKSTAMPPPPPYWHSEQPAYQGSKPRCYTW